jgi:hypothetical protein
MVQEPPASDQRPVAADASRLHELELEAARLRRAVDQISQLIDVVERSERWRIGGFFVRLYNRLRFRRMGPDALEFMRRAVALPASVASARAALPRELEVFVGEELRHHEERMSALYAETLSQMLQAAGLATPPLQPTDSVPGRARDEAPVTGPLP